MPLETKPWDASEYLDSEEAVAAYLDAAFEDGDPRLIATALGDVARARGMSEIAVKAGLSRESLYRALSKDGNPELATVLKVVRALGMRISIDPKPFSPLPGDEGSVASATL
jgi:probable addiction module antidote protein